MEQQAAGQENAGSLAGVIDAAIHCIHCDYDLQGLDVGGVCPECGTLVRKSCERYSCVKCKYCLVGLNPNGSCPECDTPVSASTFLQRSDAYLRTVSRGCSLVMITMLLSIVVGLMNILAMPYLADPTGFEGIVYLLRVANLFPYVLFTIGWCSITTRDIENPSERDPMARSRAWVRGVAGVYLVLTIAAFVSTFILEPQDPNKPNMILAGIGLLFFMLFVVLYFVSLAYMKRLAHLSMNPKIIRRASRLTWTAPLWATFGALIVIGPLVALALYYNLFLWIRKDIKSILKQRAAMSA